jgi:hypothetical protein
MQVPAETKVSISVGHACFRGLTWECELTPPGSLVGIIESLLNEGFMDESRSPRVRELLHPGEHRVVLIPSTGRVQLRLHYLTPQAERKTVARSFADLLERAAGMST